ncbi:MAG: hypothetical protein IKZ43_01345 [Acidaminococcaceae bacterium]|nr:hypothetical protein [Acidaminococcaceae bacterium]
MKKVFTLALLFALILSGVCFAEKSKLKKKTWTPVQERMENSVQVQDFYNHKEVYHEGEKQVGLWFVTFIPNQKGAAHSYFYEAVVMDYAKGQYRIIRAYQADNKNKKVNTSDQRFIDAEWKDIAGTKYEILYYRMKPSIW